MRFLLRIALAIATFDFFMGTAMALEFEPITSPGDGTFILVSGEFQVDEPLDRFTASVLSSRAEFITFNSPGGNVASAMKLGRMIRAAGLHTLQVREFQCTSACSLAFMGGVQRVADPGSIGVHRSSFSSDASITTDEAVAGVQALTANIIAYMHEMGVDPKLLAVALSYDKTDMRYLSASEMAELHVTTVNDGHAPSAPSTVPRTLPAPPPQAEAKADDQELENAAVAFVKGLIEQHGDNPNLAIAQVISSYAATVDYYGKLVNLGEVVADKRDYFQRWPERGYRVRDNSVMVTCANDRCMVSGKYDWIVRSLPRKKQAKGVARFTYTIAIGTDPRIIAEAGEVVR